MPPEHFEEVSDTGGNRVEQLANNFSSAALMPAAALERFGSWSDLSGDELIRRLNRVADELQVTASALKWRLVALDGLSRTTAQSVSDAALRNNGHAVPKNLAPPLFSKPFMEVMRPRTPRGAMSPIGVWPTCWTSPWKISRRCSVRTASNNRSSCKPPWRAIAGPGLVDTNVIIESHRVNSWRALTGGYHVATVEECIC